MSVRVGKPSPDFTTQVYRRGEPEARRLSLTELRGNWVVLFFYPRDFTFVCPTEIEAFAELEGQFLDEGAFVIGASTDSYYSHKAWYEADPRLAGVHYPVIADTSHDVTRAFGVLLEDGTALRATFVIDPEGIVRHLQVNDLDVGRNVAETLRTVQALRTGERCPAAWTPDQPTLTVATVPPARDAIQEVTDADIPDVLRQERVALVLTRRDCGYCATYLTEIEAFLRSGELEGIAVYKVVLDAPGARMFKRHNPWLADVDALPYTVLYHRGERVEMFAASKGRYFVERFVRLFGARIEQAA
jgi:peroxiredoxin (alkyl hydroperoxide reductase subunit C)